MGPSFPIILLLAIFVFFIGKSKARRLRSSGNYLHSSESHHAWFAAASVFFPAVLISLCINIFEFSAVTKYVTTVGAELFTSDAEFSLLREYVTSTAAEVVRDLSGGAVLSALFGTLSYLLSGLEQTSVSAVFEPSSPQEELIRQASETRLRFNLIELCFGILVALIGAVYALRRIRVNSNAREPVELLIRVALALCSLIAVLTTLGIVASLLFETFSFARMYPIKDFLFGTIWNPQFSGGSDLGILPLLWGTLYISFIALLFSVPIGLFSAIYLSEYASHPVRSVAKPLLELLAGIPTIVYGLFALMTVGPLIRDYLAQPMGLGSSANSVLAAGAVMGIMLIPFVSSLSDDIINAVPQSLRDGSYGLGATKSETIQKVILPAALPGIVGAILLATSRAIGETMIVVLGAGAAAKISGNPFEGMATITAKIVNQLTGDTEFESPETLVAFALGLSLFFITLGLNVLALRIVRKYREQYD